jgi:hypothetical protein
LVGPRNAHQKAVPFPCLLIGGASGLLYAVVGGTQHALQQGTTSEGAAFLLPIILYLLATLGLFGLYLLLLVRCHRGEFGSRRARILSMTLPVLFNVLLILVPPSFRSISCHTSRMATSRQAFTGTRTSSPARSSRTHRSGLSFCGTDGGRPFR